LTNPPVALASGMLTAPRIDCSERLKLRLSAKPAKSLL
jgi:hypothetical protein